MVDRPQGGLCLRIGVTALCTIGLCVSANASPDEGTWSDGSDLLPALITFHDMPGPSEQAFVSSLGGRIKYTYDLVPTIAAWLPEQALTTLGANSGVVRVERDVATYSLDTELTNSWGVTHIGAGTVHASGNRGTGVKVGIIDSGIDYLHPELSANYAGGWDFVNNDNDPRDDYGHGTKVAGVVGAADNGSGIVGVAPQADLYAYKVLNASGQGSYSDVIAALDRAVADGISVVNMSFGSLLDPGQAVRDACARAAEAGLVLVASAGNHGTLDGSGDNVTYPARYSSVIAVGATMNLDDQRALFSSTGWDVDLMAPGVDILTTDLFGEYAYESGTSIATPHVVGIAALLIYKGVSDVYSTLLTTAIDLGPEGFDPLYGYGLVSAAGAVAIPAPSALALGFLGVSLLHRKRRSRS